MLDNVGINLLLRISSQIVFYLLSFNYSEYIFPFKVSLYNSLNSLEKKYSVGYLYSISFIY